MAPRRSARVRVHNREQDVKHVKPIQVNNLAGRRLNTKGLPTMPAELLLEILSHLQAAPIPNTDKLLDGRYRERNTVLRALSQTCRSLRSALLPLVWERIDVLNDSYHSGRASDWCKIMATDLVEQLEIVTVREPSFAAYVKTVNVTITGYSDIRVLRELARCLALMPNLQTIQIVDMLDFACSWRSKNDPRTSVEAIFERAFKLCSFPSVQQVILPVRARMLFKCFPNAHRVYLNPALRRYYIRPPNHDFDSFNQYLLEVAKHCQNVEEFDCFDELGQNSMDLVLSTFPKLRSMRIYVRQINMAFISRLSELKKLEKIELIAPNWSQSFQEKRMEAMRVLENSPVETNRKMLVTRIKSGDRVEVVKFTP
ncbi:hypothetical protein APHAL10511_002454 [Amanita phalloides]|nr:hypothetical protein APHAL10511_002454 [Amanita phalloides]